MKYIVWDIQKENIYGYVEIKFIYFLSDFWKCVLLDYDLFEGRYVLTPFCNFYHAGNFKYTYEGGTPPKLEFIYKNGVFILTFKNKLQSSSKYSPFDAIHLLRPFSHCSKQFYNSSSFMPFSAFAVFCFTSSTLGKRFPLKNFFIRGNKESQWDWVIREGGAHLACCFWSKTAEHSVWAGAL